MFGRRLLTLSISITGLLLSSVSAVADDGNYSVTNRAFDFFTNSANGWTKFGDDDGHIGPGGGGQRYDAEYLFYRYNDSNHSLSIGLQTGFDVNDGKYSNHYAGDLALSFDGSTAGVLNGYEYAVDFGLVTRDINDNTVNNGADSSDGVVSTGQDTAGLYSVSEWSNEILHSESSPFAMDEGSWVTGLSENTSDGYGSIGSRGYGFSDGVNNSGIDSSFYRVVTFDLSNIVAASAGFTVDAHWTMSCGNDAINGNMTIAGTTDVPEPSVLALFGIGALGIGLAGYRRRKRN